MLCLASMRCGVLPPYKSSSFCTLYVGKLCKFNENVKWAECIVSLLPLTDYHCTLFESGENAVNNSERITRHCVMWSRVRHLMSVM